MQYNLLKGSWNQGKGLQTSRPTLQIKDLFKSKKDVPVGKISKYSNIHGFRFGKEKYEQKDKMIDHQVECLRKSAEVHRQVRKYAQSIARPGIKLIDLCKQIESTLRYLIIFYSLTN